MPVWIADLMYYLLVTPLMGVMIAGIAFSYDRWPSQVGLLMLTALTGRICWDSVAGASLPLPW